MISPDFTIALPLAGGALIGLATLIGMAATGIPPGISGLCSEIIRGQKGEVAWRLCYLAGMIGGGVLAFRLIKSAGDYAPPHSLAVMALAGLLVGIGTRVGGGCTSGHGVCGIGLGSRRSIVATLIFMGSAMATVYVMKHLAGGAAS
jgi:uncharacterized membrane protein YedE/YeeE